MPQQLVETANWLDVAEQIAEQTLMTCGSAADRESTEALRYLREATENRKSKEQTRDS